MFTSTDAKSAASFSSAVAPPPALETDSLRAGAAAAAAGGPPGGGGGALVTSFSVRRSFSFEANAAFGSSASLPMATTDAPWMRAAAASSSASPPAGLTWILIVPVSPMASFTDTASPGSVLPRITSPEAPAASSRRSAASRRERKSPPPPPPPFPSPSPFSSPPKNHFDIREKKPSSPAVSPGADAVIAAVAYSVEDDGGAEGGDVAAAAASYAIAADDFWFFGGAGGAGDGAAAGAAAGAAENHDDVGCFLGGVGFVAAGAAGDDENQDFSADLGGAGGDDFPFALVGVAVPAGLAAARGVSFATPLAETAPFFGVTPRRPPRTRWLIAPCFRECAMSSESAPMCAAWPLAGEGARAACFASATFLECAISNESAPTCATSPRYFGGVAAREFAGTSFFCCATRYESGEPGLPFGGVGGLGTTRRGIAERWEAAICSRRRVSRPKSSCRKANLGSREVRARCGRQPCSAPATHTP